MKQESESKRKLLEAAIDLIWKSSYGAVSVDDICEQAGVNKGSFYYAFKCKSDLAVAAYERYWENKRAKMDGIFSAAVPAAPAPGQSHEAIIADQTARYKEYGKMPGCPFCSIGSELGTQDENIRAPADQHRRQDGKYNESLVRDLAAEGLIETQQPGRAGAGNVLLPCRRPDAGQDREQPEARSSASSTASFACSASRPSPPPPKPSKFFCS